MKLVLIVEGHAEQGLERFFQSRFSKTQVVNMKGGDKLLNKFWQIAERELKQNPDTYIVCLVDFDKAAERYPYKSNQANYDIHEHFLYIRFQMENFIDQTLRTRVKCFPVMKAIEAWILADQIGLREYLGLIPFQLPPAPEEMDKPKKKLIELFQTVKGQVYSESKDGKKLLEQDSKAQRIYDDNCPFFCRMWDEIIKWELLSTPKQVDLRLSRINELKRSLTETNQMLQKCLQRLEIKEKVLTEDEFIKLVAQENDLYNRRLILEAEIAKLES